MPIQHNHVREAFYFRAITQGYPWFKMFLPSIFLLSWAFIIKAVAYENQPLTCPMKHAIEPLITRPNVRLKEHQREILKSQSFPQCSLRCVQKDWCISINFEAAKREGICELNDYGVENEYYLLKDERNEFEVSKEFIYSQLRPSKFGCPNNPCSNGGSCFIDCDDSTKTRCVCPEGFVGDRCNYINECVNNPCQNGGSCLDKVDGYSCTCAAGFNGTNCEQDIDECLSNPCRNSATCTDKVNGYTCTCMEGFQGENCQLDACDAKPCKNGATCSLAGVSFSCACATGFTGVTCDVVNSAECTAYTNITDPTRNVNYAKVNRTCDSISFTGWYRLTGGAGVAMPSTCIPQYRCNTDATGWLKDPHPTIQEGIVIRQVCFSFSGNCCNWPRNIRVRNCGAYYVYEFTKIFQCYLRYCGQS